MNLSINLELLANFYLQGYDKKIKQICDKSDATYIRFADDQIIIVKDKTKINNIMYVMAKELNSIGLNLNASKVKEYNKDTIQIFYGISIFKLLDKKSIVMQLKSFLNIEEQKELIERIYIISSETNYNAFHYNAINFIKNVK